MILERGLEDLCLTASTVPLMGNISTLSVKNTEENNPVLTDSMKS